MLFSVVTSRDPQCPGWEVMIFTADSPDAPRGETMTIGTGMKPDREVVVADAIGAARSTGTAVFVEDLTLTDLIAIEAAGVTLVEEMPDHLRIVVETLAIRRAQQAAR